MLKNVVLFLIFYFSQFCTFGQDIDPGQLINIPKPEFQLDELIQYLDKNYQCKFAFETQVIQQTEPLIIDQKQLKLTDLLNLICKKFQLEYKISKGQIILKKETKSQKATLHGYIFDAATGESLGGCSIYSLSNQAGTSSNSYGYYSITLPPGQYKVCFSFIGYKPVIMDIDLTSDQNIDARLTEDKTELQEVTVKNTSDDSRKHDIAAGFERMNIRQISAFPTFLGEVDIMKGIEHLPGIQSVNDGISLLSVRGGTFDQNLVLLDEAPVYNPAHVLGFFSVFNPDAVNSADIYKGYIPANYGGRISSVIDIRMKEGNRKRFSATANVNLFASRLSIETPIINENTSLLLAGRYSYTSGAANLGKELSNVIYMYEYNNYPSKTKINFWDLNAKLNHRFNAKNHLYLSAYNGSDYFFYPVFDKRSNVQWGNTTATLRWNHLFNNRLFSNTSFVYSKYQYAYLFFDNGYSYNWKAGMNEAIAKTDFDWNIQPNHYLKFGFSANQHLFDPGKIEPKDSLSAIEPYQMNSKHATEASVYGSYQFTYSKWLIETGIRLNNFYSYYQRDENKVNKNRINAEPRLALKYQINPNQYVKLGYSRTYQYLHLINNASIGMPTDLWVPADKYINPQMADQVSAGYSIDLNEAEYRFSTDVYYKKLQNIIDFVDNANLFMNPAIEMEIRAGKGICYGSEWSFSKQTGKIQGNLSYTLAKAEKTIPGINSGKTYPFSHDNRHVLSANVNVEFLKRWFATADFTYKSGSAITMVEGFYYYESIPFTIYSDRNGYRLPAYHKLDISVTHKNKQVEGRRWQMEWTVGMNNVYNRKNVFAVFFDRSYSENFGHLRLLYLFGRLPYFSLTFKI